MVSDTITRERPRARAMPRRAAVRLSWQHVGLALTLLVAAGLNFWQLARLGYANSYYAATVRSMLTSWHNFFFASFDPGGFVTVDKPPLGFWIQTASAKIFGFHGWSLLLPEALAGVLSVALLYHLVRRAFGATAGLVAALALAVTPISVVTNRNNTIDSLLVLTVLCAAWAIFKATETGKLRWLLASMALVGLGFNIKMLEAYLVVPALVVVYLFGVKHGWGKRIAHLALGIVVLLAVSLSWAVAVDLTPASQRPWVGSTTDNSEVSLAIGYNGLQRLLGHRIAPPAITGQTPAGAQPADDGQAGVDSSTTNNPAFPDDGRAARADGANGAGGGFPGAPGGGFIGGGPGGPGGGGPGGTGENGPKGVLRLLDQQLGGQIGWLIPTAVIGLLAGVWALFIRRSSKQPSRPEGTRSSQQSMSDDNRSAGSPFRLSRIACRLLNPALSTQHSALLLWGMWFLTMAVFFSVAGMFHRYYLSMLAPGVAALVGIGVALLWRAFRQRRPLGWLLPVAILATVAMQAKILRDYPAYARWMTPTILDIGIAAALVLALSRVRLASPVRTRVVAAAATAGIAIMLFAPTVWAGVSVRDGGGGGLPAAGPAQQGGFGFPGGNRDGGNAPDAGQGTNSALLAYLEANRGNAKFLVAVPSSMSADSIIINTGEPVMAMGGFSGSDPILTAQSVAQLVQDGTVRFFLLGGGGPGGQQSATSWVTSSCTAVPSSAYQSSTTTTGGFGFGGGTLYDCASAATKG